MKYEEGNVLVKVNLLKNVIITDEQYQKMINNGYIYIDNIKYIYMYDDKAYSEEYRHKVYNENENKELYYCCIKTNNGYYFEREIGGSISYIDYVDKEIMFYLDYNTKVYSPWFGIEEDDEIYVWTLQERKEDYLNYSLHYSDKDGIYLLGYI